MTNNLPTEDIFLTGSEEQEYLTKHKVLFQKLDNGIITAGTARNARDTFHTSLNFSFQSGSFFDPKGKEGLHHFIEHLIIYPIKNIAQENEVRLNASTGPLYLAETASGLANPNVLNYGIWPMLQPAIDRVIDPLAMYSNIEEKITQEKKTVSNEINEYYASHDQQAARFFYNTIYSPDNPIISQPLGTKETIADLTINDIRQEIDKIFVPQNLDVGFLCEGSDDDCQLIMNKLSDILVKFPKANNPGRKTNWSDLEKLNPGLKPDVFTSKPLSLKNNLITVYLIWPVNFPMFSIRYAAISTLADWMQNKIFMLSRQLGWGYSASTRLTFAGEENGVVYVRLDIPKITDDQLQKFIAQAKSEISKLLNQQFENVNKILEIAKTRQTAVPLSSETRLYWVFSRYRRYGKTVNADKFKGLYAKMTKEDLDQWIKYLADTAPSAAVIGDLE